MCCDIPMGTFNTICILFILSSIHYNYVTSEKSNHDFDLLIFTQQWPATTCKEWKKHDPSNTCSMPKKVDDWTIHGIWPTKLGTRGPSFCNRTWLFDPEKIRPIEDQLTQVWTNIFGGTSVFTLWSHEWNKHGTCAAVLKPLNSEFNYFSTGISWLQTYSMLNILQSSNIVPSNTASYSINDINDAIKKRLQKDPVIECKKEDGLSYISDIRICFTKDLIIADCDGVLGQHYKVIGNQSILTNCDASQKVVYPHYKSTLYVQLFKLVTWLQWFTL